MSRVLVLVALVWVPFLAVFGFASPLVADAVGDSYPHVAFHVLAPLMLVGALVIDRRLLRDAHSRSQRSLLWLLSVTLTVAVVGNLVELAAAVRRLAADGWVSLRTPDVFEGGGLHGVGANLTIPGLMLSMVAVLALAVTVAVQHRRRLEPV